MKINQNLQKWIPSALVGLALAGSASLGLAADITYDFASDVQGWGGGNADTAVVWDNTHNRGGGGGGCLKCTLTPVPSTGNTLAANIDVAYDTSGYFSVEFDMFIDATSATDGAGLYGNLQVADFDSGWAWHSQWYGSIGDATGKFTNWCHVKLPFGTAYGPRAHLQILVQSSSGDYSGNVIAYIDNVVFRDGTPPNKAMLFGFDWPEQCVPNNSWGAGPPVFSHDTTLTNGCLKEVVNYGSGNTGWQDAPAEMALAFDPSKFTYLDFDLYLDAPTGLPSYGQYELNNWWAWNSIGAVGLSAANIGTWTHYSLPLPAGTYNGLVLHPGGNNMSGVFTYYLDNVTLWKPAGPPTITRLTKNSGAGGGVMITMDGPGSQWTREAIVTQPATGAYFWAPQGIYPVSYSFTITNFPATPAHRGFAAYMYIVNADTGGGDTAWNATYGGVDWNVPDIFMFAVENNAAGGVIAHIDWKTNLPNGNPLADAIYHPLTTNGTTALGTWTLEFTSATDGTLTGPGISATPFTMPGEAVTNNFSPAAGYIHFGMFKNDGANDGHNNYANGTFSRVQMIVNGGAQFDDSFTTDLSAWRKTTSSKGASLVQWSPAGIDTWLTWSTPDDGYEAYVCGTVNGTYTDAGVGAATGYSYTLGATRIGGIPAASMPAGSGNAAFFQLRKN
jgi:hypothetical protein